MQEVKLEGKLDGESICPPPLSTRQTQAPWKRAKVDDRALSATPVSFTILSMADMSERFNRESCSLMTPIDEEDCQALVGLNLKALKAAFVEV